MLLQILVVFHVLETFSSKLHHCFGLLELMLLQISVVFCVLETFSYKPIIVVAYISLLNMSLNFELKISMLLKFIQVIWTCF
jgi:hypothetical protein